MLLFIHLIKNIIEYIFFTKLRIFPKFATRKQINTQNEETISYFDNIDAITEKESGDDFTPTYIEDGKTPFGAIRLDERILSTGLYTAGRYCISQATGHNSYSVSYPTCADSTLTDTLKSVFYANNILALNPTHSRVVCAIDY